MSKHDSETLLNLAKAWDDVTSVEGAEEQSDTYGLWTVELDGETWAVGTDEEADSAVSQAIGDSLWAFNADFIAGYFLPAAVQLPAIIKAIQAWQSEQCESCNDDMREMVGGRFDELVEDAVSADGRGHFLATYDGEEEEVKTADGRHLYCYRIN